MSIDNPYAPPAQSAALPPDQGLVFSPEGAAVVASLATWMRALGFFYYLGAGLMLLGGGCGAMAAMGGGAAGAGGVMFLVFGLTGVFIIAAASWVRSAGDAFERGVLADDELTLGAGFRSLRKYLIMFGIFGIIQAIATVVGAL